MFGLLSVPSFLAGLLLIMVVVNDQGWFPRSQWVRITDSLTGNLHHAILPAIERAVAEAELYGLRYHSDCIGRMQNAFELACEEEITDPEQAAQVLFAASSCKLVAGDGGRGDACLSVGQLAFGTLGDTCSPSTVCQAGVCVPRPKTRGDLCAGLGACPPDLVGSALAIQNGLGFALSIGAIAWTSASYGDLGPEVAWLLLPGPVLGLAAMARDLRGRRTPVA